MAKIYDSTGKAMLDVTTVDEQSWKKRLQDKLDEFDIYGNTSHSTLVNLHFRTFTKYEDADKDGRTIYFISPDDDFIVDISTGKFEKIFAMFKATPAIILNTFVPQEMMAEWVGAGYTIESNVRFFRKKKKGDFPDWSKYNMYDENGDLHMCYPIPMSGMVECPVTDVILEAENVDVINNDEYVSGLFGHQPLDSEDKIWLPLLRGVAKKKNLDTHGFDAITSICIKPRGKLFRKSDNWSSYGTNLQIVFYNNLPDGYEMALEDSYVRGCIHIPCAFAQEFVVKDNDGNVVFKMESRKVEGAIKVSAKATNFVDSSVVTVDIENNTIDVWLKIMFEPRV